MVNNKKALIRAISFFGVVFATALWISAAFAAEEGSERLARAARGVKAPSPGRDFSQPAPGSTFGQDRVFVRFASSLEASEYDSVLAQIGGGVILRRYDFIPGLCLVDLPASLSVESALVVYNADNRVLYSEPNYTRHSSQLSQNIPNDTLFTSQWDKHNEGSFVFYESTFSTLTATFNLTTSSIAVKADADMDGPEAWSLATGSKDVVIAVLDTGIDYNHPDFKDQMWINVHEIPGNGVDDDNNGYVDDRVGYDFAYDDPNPADSPEPPPARNENWGHGTHVAGIAAARGNDGYGIAGVAWNAKLMALKFIPSDGPGDLVDAIEGIRYATMMGADIINASYSSIDASYSQAEKDAIDAAGAVGIIFVAAAGNDSNNNDFGPNYPSNYPSANLISVMSSDPFDRKSSFSNFGEITVDIAAPGSSILSTWPLNHPFGINLDPPTSVSLEANGLFQYLSGTSMAAPQVAGAAALLKSYNPTLDVQNVKQALIKNADQLPAFQDLNVSDGRLNISNAMRGIVIQDVTQTYFAPYMLEYSLSLRNMNGTGITDFVTSDKGLNFDNISSPQSVICLENENPISPTETEFQLAKGELKQFKGYLVLDYTGSMQADADTDGDGKPQAINNMENAAIDFATSLTQDSQLGIYEYHVESRAPKKIIGFSKSVTSITGKILGDARQDGIWDNIGDFYGGSRCWDAVYAAVGEFEGGMVADEQRVVIMLSDGRDESSASTPEDIIALAKQLKVSVYTIGFQVGGDPVALENLRKIAYRTGGLFFPVESPAEFGKRYDEIHKDLASQYVLRWATLRNQSQRFEPSFEIGVAANRNTLFIGQEYVVANYTGDRLEGQLRWVGLVDETTGAVDVTLRATYVPRDIRHLTLEVPTGIPAPTLLPDGLTQSWDLDPSGGLWDLTTTTAALPFASFGPILELTFADQALAVSWLTSVTVVNDYSNDQSFTLESYDVPAEEPKDWTFLTFLNGDNFQEAGAIADFGDLAAEGSSDDVNVVALFDRAPGGDATNGDWTGARRGLIDKGDSPDALWGESAGELNMGDPKTLSDFLEWAMSAYPADRYALVFPKAAPDITSGDTLAIGELRKALETVLSSTGKRMNLLGFDSDEKSTLEIAYEIRSLAEVMVSSEETQSPAGWPYDNILLDLLSSPGMDAPTLGAAIVDRYFTSTGRTMTIAAIDLSQVESLANDVNLFAQTLRDNWKTNSSVCISAAEMVKIAIEAAVIQEAHGPDANNSHGFSIYFPKTSAEFDAQYNGTQLLFPGAINWEEFLQDYYQFMIFPPWVSASRGASSEYVGGDNVDLFNFCEKLILNDPKEEIPPPIPNDLSFDSQWSLHNAGQLHGSVKAELGKFFEDPAGNPYYEDPNKKAFKGRGAEVSGTTDADIDAPEAWKVITGNRDVVVAVIDWGVDYTHPDLKGNMWTNEAELNGLDDVDDDGNGFVDDIYGYNFGNSDGNPAEINYDNPFWPQWFNDAHGTHVAGIIGAVGDNTLGVTGLCWQVRIMALKYVGFDRNLFYDGPPPRTWNPGIVGGTDVEVIASIKYAIQMGADIIITPVGEQNYNQDVLDAILEAKDAGILIVTPAGNGRITNRMPNGVGMDNEIVPNYPGSYPADNILSVMSTNHLDSRSDFSNWGENLVDLAAPGTDIFSTDLGDEYQYQSGTGMAAAHVAGASALLLSYNNTLSIEQIKKVLIDSSDPKSILEEKCVANGRLNVAEALKYVLPASKVTYSVPYLLEYNFTPRNAEGNAINDQPANLMRVCMEDGFEISKTETNQILKKFSKQFKGYLVLDYSSSMQAGPDSDSDGKSDAVESMETSSIWFANELTREAEDAQLGVYEFHIEDRLPTKVMDFSANPTTIEQNILGITSTIGDFHGGSRCWDAVFGAIESIRDGVLDDEQRVVVFLSDGRDESSAHSVEDIKNLANAIDVRVYCIGYGAELDSVALRDIANSTGGRYYAAADSSFFQDKFTNILRDLQGNYTLRWATLKDDTQKFIPTFTIEQSGTNLAKISGDNPEFNVGDYAGDRRQGELRWESSMNTATSVKVVLRATYVPRDISWLELQIPAGLPTPTLITTENGLMRNWTMTSGGGVLRLESSDGSVLPFADFGPILQFIFDKGATIEENDLLAENLLDQVIVNNNYPDEQTFQLGAFDPTKEWNIFVYLDGDNSLEASAIQDFLELASVGTTDEVNVIAMFDRSTTGTESFDDWSDTRRGLIEQGDEPNTLWGQSAGEANMGDPDTLSEFVIWGSKEYPAERYAVILWDHGNGWVVCQDDTDEDALEMSELSEALGKIEFTVGRRPAIIGFDASLMAFTEAAYEIRQDAGVLVGSEAGIPSTGWPYADILTDLAANPTMTTETLAISIVDNYFQSYGGVEILSAVDLKQMDALAAQVNIFAQTVLDVWQTSDISSAGTAALNLVAAVDNAVLYERHDDSFSGAHGLSIYFPETIEEFSSAYGSGEFLFLQENVAPRWKSLVEQYYASMQGFWVQTVREQTLAFGATDLGPNRLHIDLSDFATKVTEAVPQDEKLWTFLLYLDGDNALETQAIDNFLQLSSLSASDDVNVVALFDRGPSDDARYENWTDTRRGLIEPGDAPDTTWGASMGELNMGDRNTLANFVQWGMLTYPAENVALVLWGQGDGWQVCLDATSQFDALTRKEIREGLEGIESTVGTVDLIGFDAALMGMAEVAYELRERATVMVGSEEGVLLEGWPYGGIVGDLIATPSMTPATLGELIVNRYMTASVNSATMSAIDLTTMDALGLAINSFSQVLQDNWNSDYNAVVLAAGGLMGAVETTVLEEGHASVFSGSYGLSIYFPDADKTIDPRYDSSLTLLSDATQWDEFLQSYRTSMGTSWIGTARELTQEFNINIEEDSRVFVDLFDFALKLTSEVPPIGHEADINSVQFSPDGTAVLTGGDDGTARIWDAVTLIELQVFKDHEGAVNSVAYSPDGTRILTGGDDGTAKIWDIATGAVLFTLDGHNTEAVTSVAYSADGTRVATASKDETALIWNATLGSEIRRFSGHAAVAGAAANPLTSVAFSAGGTRLLTGSEDDTAIYWDADTGAEIWTFVGHSGDVNSVAISPNGDYALTGSADGTAKLWLTDTGKEIQTYTGQHTGPIMSVAFSPDGLTVLTGSADFTARVWDIDLAVEVLNFIGHEGSVNSAVFSPDGMLVITGSSDGSALIWNSATLLPPVTNFQAGSSSLDPRITLTWTNPNSTLNPNIIIRRALDNYPTGPTDGYLAFEGLGTFTIDDEIIEVGAQYFYSVWAHYGGESYSAVARATVVSGVDQPLNHSDDVRAVAYSPDGNWLLTGGSDNIAKIWHTRGLLELIRFEGHTGPINSVDVSPDATRILTGSDDGTAIIWNAVTGDRVQTLTGHTGPVNSVAFSPDGLSILTGSDDETARLWDAGSGALLFTLSGHVAGAEEDPAPVNAVAFSPDGNLALTGSDDKTAKLWNTSTGAEVRTFWSSAGRMGAVSAVAVSSDGTQILTASNGPTWDGGEDRAARLWNLATGEEIRTFVSSGSSFSHLEDLTSVDFSSDGIHIVTASMDDTAVLWNRSTGEKVKTFTGHTDDVNAAVFSPDGTQVLTGSSDDSAQIWYVLAPPTNSIALLPNDYNGDGQSDLIRKRLSTGEITISLMNPGGQDWTDTYTSNWTSRYELLGTGDFNGDGRQDLILKYTSSSTVYICLMNEDATSWNVTYYSPGWYEKYTLLGIGDLNGDGRDDLILRYDKSNTVYICHMNPEGADKIWEVVYYSQGWAEKYTVLGVGDLNADGRDDMILRYNASGTVYFCVMHRDGKLWDVAHFESWGDLKTLLAMADLNGDDREDLIVRDNPTGTVSFLITGTDGGSWTPSYSEIADWASYTIIGTRDLNGDGRDDIIRKRNDGTVEFCLISEDAASWTVSFSDDWSDLTLVD